MQVLDISSHKFVECSHQFSCRKTSVEKSVTVLSAGMECQEEKLL